MARRRAAWLLTLALSAAPAAADEAAIVSALRAHAATEDPAAREALAAAIAADPAFERRRLPEWLHRAGEWPAVEAGLVDFEVDVGLGQSRRVTARVPHGYDAGRAWPLVYALHPSGGTGRTFVAYLESLLGRDLERFLVVAPSGYRQTGLDAPPPFTDDHVAVLRETRRRFHVDADRQVAVGYSLGGYAAWQVALFHGDELAAAAPLAATLTVPPGDDGVWEDVLPNLAVPVLAVWGERDSTPLTTIDGRPAGTMAAMNRRLVASTRERELPIRHWRDPRAGHGDLRVPRSELLALLASRREPFPRRIGRVFRHLHQGRLAWLEAEAWAGESWGAEPPRPRAAEGESALRALGRWVRERLARLTGEVDGQEIRVETRHLAAITVWIGDGLVDWSRPVALVVDGRRLFEGRLRPDLAVALAAVARTADRERIPWAGLAVRGLGGPEPRAEVVAPAPDGRR